MIERQSGSNKANEAKNAVLNKWGEMPAAAEPPSPEPVAGAGPGAMWWCSCPAWDSAADTIIAKITHIMAKEAIDFPVAIAYYTRVLLLQLAMNESKTLTTVEFIQARKAMACKVDIDPQQ